MSEKFNLKWNAFQSNVSRTFSLLRSEEEFFDVSLVAADQKMMSAHKLVLSACSPYFKHILTQNKHSHPLLCLDGVSSGELQSVLDYIYQGEVQVYQEQLDRFLEVAQRLKLDGLKLTEHERQLQFFKEDKTISDSQTFTGRKQVEKQKTKPNISKSKQPTSAILIYGSFGTIEEIDEKIGQHIYRGENRRYCCALCGKSMSHRGHMNSHVESHFDGLSFPCQTCGQTFRSRNLLAQHNHKFHRKYTLTVENLKVSSPSIQNI